MRHWKKTAIALLAAALLVSAWTGCARREAAPTPAPGAKGVRPLNTAAPATPVPGGTDGTGRLPIRNPQAVARHLEMLARGVRGVNDATCVVFGNYAIVGIDVDAKMDRSRVGTTKYAVAEALRKDPYGVDALVTADMDLSQRLKEIRADVQRGRPIAGFAEELGDIVGRVMPQMPRSIVPPASPDHDGGQPPAKAGSGSK
jgi:YhcN/YlaJ family sporulation lipoprotein